MKKALSYKILLLLITLALSLALALSFSGTKPARADNVEVTNSIITSYFSGANAFNLDGTNLVATVKDGENKVKIENKLVVDDLAIELNVPATIASFKVILTYDSYFVNGAYKDGKFDKEITNEFTFTDHGDLNIVITTANNAVTVNTQVKDDYYKIKGADKCSAEIAFEFTLAENVDSADIVFKSIDQKASDASGSYKQTFALDDETHTKIANFAKPRVSVDNLQIVKEGGQLKVIKGTNYSFSFTAYSVFGNVSSGSLYIDRDSIDASDALVDTYSDTPKKIAFKNNAEKTFSIRTNDISGVETYTVLAATDYNADATAPEYIDYAANANVYDGYKVLVKKAATKEYTDADGKTSTHSIRLGDSFEIPSLQDLVTDKYDVYANLKYTVYYRTPSNASGSTTSMKFTVSEAGDYEFFVVFKDANGNSMEKDQFYKVDENDGNVKITDEKTIYKDAVFSFTVDDDAPMSVEVTDKQGKGYLNTKYTASAFKIQSSGYNVTYTLYYNATENATADTEKWVKVPKLSDVTEEYNENGFTYSDIEKTGYDGEYTFTPVKKGTYRIDCEITSDMSERHSEGSTFISVTEEPKVVKVDTHWLRNNIWSVVFLSIGTLSLIGIIVLLFIKPKEEAETDETGDALNVNKK